MFSSIEIWFGCKRNRAAHGHKQDELNFNLARKRQRSEVLGGEASSLVTAGQAEITAARKKTRSAGWWEMGRLWGWNVLQVVKGSRDGRVRRGRDGVKPQRWLQFRENPNPRRKRTYFFFSLQISLWHSFHCFIKIPKKKKSEPCTCFPTVGIVSRSSKKHWRATVYS